MRSEATRGANAVAPTPQPTEQRSGTSGSKGFAGGSHRGAIYRHTPRSPAPNPRPGAPRPRRPPTPHTAGGHHDEHAIHPEDLRNAMEDAARQFSVDGQRQQPGNSGRQAFVTPPVRPPELPRVRAMPSKPVNAGAALRRSHGPDVARLQAPPAPGGTPWPTLFATLASAFFNRHGHAQGNSTAQRLSASLGAARHLPPDAGPVTLAIFKEAAVGWMNARRQSALPEAPPNDHLMFPIYALNNFRPRLEGSADTAPTRAEMILRGLESAPKGASQ